MGHPVGFSETLNDESLMDRGSALPAVHGQNRPNIDTEMSGAQSAPMDTSSTDQRQHQAVFDTATLLELPTHGFHAAQNVTGR